MKHNNRVPNFLIANVVACASCHRRIRKLRRCTTSDALRIVKNNVIPPTRNIDSVVRNVQHKRQKSCSEFPQNICSSPESQMSCKQKGYQMLDSHLHASEVEHSPPNFYSKLMDFVGALESNSRTCWQVTGCLGVTLCFSFTLVLEPSQTLHVLKQRCRFIFAKDIDRF